jgi:endonuclease/exonuclease/phosphatase family metal-dependent hydrolase
MKTYRFLHWNIKELDAQAIADRTPAFLSSTHIIRQFSPDLLSINELEFGTHTDSPHFGQLLAHCVDHPEQWSQTFYAANSGQKARPGADGRYLRFHERLTPTEREVHLDHANYGLFPGQFSIALGSRFPISKRLLVRDLSWQDWDPSLSFDSLDLGGRTPANFPLFDKSFQVSWVELGSQTIAIITLHTVPAFDFGQAKSPNVLRNAAQLEFLSWFITGRHPRGQTPQIDIKPLAPQTPFIAVGDFNIALNSPHPGARALQFLYSSGLCHSQVSQISPDHLQAEDMLRSEHTFFSSGWDQKKGAAQLDYFVVSKQLHISSLETIFYSPRFQDIGLFATREQAEQRAQEISPTARDHRIFAMRGAQGQDYFLLRRASEGFAHLREASDHLPLLLQFSL